MVGRLIKKNHLEVRFDVLQVPKTYERVILYLAVLTTKLVDIFLTISFLLPVSLIEYTDQVLKKNKKQKKSLFKLYELN